MLKVKASITEEDPCFKVKYIGCIETFIATGKGCTNGPVQKIWDNCGPERSLEKVYIVINTSGILFVDSDKKGKYDKVFLIENISFCNADSVINERIFSWICKDKASSSLICHAVLCSSREKAKAMALVLSRAFQIAYKEWKMEKVKEQRDTHKEKTKALEAAACGTYPKKYPSTKDVKRQQPEMANQHESHEDTLSVSASCDTPFSQYSESEKVAYASDGSVTGEIFQDHSVRADMCRGDSPSFTIQQLEETEDQECKKYMNSF